MRNIRIEDCPQCRMHTLKVEDKFGGARFEQCTNCSYTRDTGAKP